ncbi:fimbrial protein [Providencia vermicola]|uniref:fimbrial protein n=1 Tax=Providencia vermicola TaxID=333965 RepID=UPI001CEC2E64|nr:fimbrial protein [Providencia vermicola]
MKKFALSLLLVSGSLFAADQQININVHGYVTAMPCELDTTNYVIDLKKINIWNIKDTQKSPWVDFSVKLKNCPLSTTEAIMTLSGTPDTTTPDYFINNGTAKNVALNLANTANKVTIKNGDKISVPVHYPTRSVEFSFSARVVGYGSGMEPGSFRSHLEFNLVYH